LQRLPATEHLQSALARMADFAAHGDMRALVKTKSTNAFIFGD